MLGALAAADASVRTTVEEAFCGARL